MTFSRWFHVAISRSGSSWWVAFNGSLFTTRTDASAMDAGNVAKSLVISPVYQSGFNGLIDDLRITKGVARYTTNFLVPQFPFPDAFNPNEIVEYPPAALTGASTPISGQAYGNGTYTVSASSIADTMFAAFQGFDKATGENVNSWASGPNYNTTTGLHPGIGEWLDITLPSAITLSSYSIQLRTNSINSVARIIGQAPISFAVQAWNGTTWLPLSTQTDISAWTTSAQVRTFTPTTNSAPYNRFRILITKVQNGADGLGYTQIGEWRLFGY